jgi:hypothetical protein
MDDVVAHVAPVRVSPVAEHHRAQRSQSPQAHNPHGLLRAQRNGSAK